MLKTTSHFNGILNLSTRHLFILGALIRLMPAAFTAHPTDIVSWMTIGSSIFHGQNPYALSSFGLVYPPLWGFVCGIVYASFAATQSPFVFNFLIKLPIVLADLTLAKYIRKFVLERTKNEKTSKEAMILYLFNPVTIILSGIWGMFDSIPVFLTLLSTIFLFKRQYVRSSLFLGIAIAFKGFYPAMLLPMFLYLVKNEVKIRGLIKYLVLSVIVPFIVSAPFLAADATAFVNMTVIHFEHRQLSNLTYWFAIRLAFSQNQDLVSFVAFASFATLFSMAYLYLMKQAKLNMVMLSISQIILAFFLTSPTVNEQYLVWLLVPLIVYATIEDHRIKLFLYALTVIDTIFILANTGPGFLTPLNLSFGPFQDLWSITPILVICAILFSVVSLANFRKIIKRNSPIVNEMEQ
jgi:Gpi18-like mannosyltransferase